MNTDLDTFLAFMAPDGFIMKNNSWTCIIVRNACRDSTYSNNLYDAIVTQPHLRREGVEEFESSLMTMYEQTYGSGRRDMVPEHFCRDHSPERLTGLMRKAVQTCNVELIYHLATCWDRIGDVQDFMNIR
jgi:hypothetical protein